MPAVPTPFLFNAQVMDFHDGDTGTFYVDRGCRDYSTWTIRFDGCNAIELAQPGGVDARDEVKRRLPPGSACVLATVKPDKYGNRLDARIFYVTADGVTHDLIADLIADGWAAAWDGTGPQPKPAWPRTQGLQ